MRIIVSIFLLVVIVLGITLALIAIPFDGSIGQVGGHYIENGIKETGATNIVTSVVLEYRGFDTLGEVTILFIAAIGLGAVLATGTKNKNGSKNITPASLIVYTGCRFLFPLIILFGFYVFVHGHLSPGGGFQGGAVIASAFVLIYMARRGRKLSMVPAKVMESLGGLVFVLVGLIGLAIGGQFLYNFLPLGVPNTLLSAGIIPIIYIAIGFKVGSELTGVIDNLIEES